MKVAKLSAFTLGIATRWSLKAILAGNGAGPLGITTLTVAISLHRGPKFEVAKHKVAIYVLTEVRRGG